MAGLPPRRPLPGILEEIAEIAGDDAALSIAAAKGGTQVYFPKSWGLRDKNWLVRTVGIEHARAIAKHLGGLKLDVPAATWRRRHKLIMDELGKGKSGRQIAQMLRIDQKTVQRHRNLLKRLEKKTARNSNILQPIAIR